MKREGAKTPPEPPEPIVKRDGQDLGQDQDGEEAERVFPMQRFLHGRVADAENLRQPQAQGADHQPARQRLEILLHRDVVEAVFEPVESPGEAEADDRRQHGQQGVEGQLADADQLVARYREGGHIAKGGSPDHRSGQAGEDHDAEGAGGELPQDDLEREEDARDRGVEGGRDATGRAACNQRTYAIVGHLQDLAEGRAERRADLHDRAFTADRAARADADRGGQRLHHGHNRADAPATQCDGVHHLRHAVTLGLAREEIDERAEDQSAEGGNEDDGSGAEDVLQGRLGNVEKDVREELDQVAEEDGADARADPDGDPAGDQHLRLAWVDALQEICQPVGGGGIALIDQKRLIVRCGLVAPVTGERLVSFLASHA